MEVKCNKDLNISGIYRPVTVNVILQLAQKKIHYFQKPNYLRTKQERKLINTTLKKKTLLVFIFFLLRALLYSNT